MSTGNETTENLRIAGQKYRWAGPAKLQVLCKGNLFQVSDYDSGLQLLRDLGIALPAMEEEGKAGVAE